MMGSKLEECARVLCKAAGRNPDFVWTDGKPEWTMYVDNARAVIRCLMEPNENMADKGESALIMNDGVWIDIAADKGYPTGTWAAAVTSYRAMLQSVLDEGK